MKQLRIPGVCAIALTVAFAGCTRIAVDEPIGRPLDSAELVEIAGDWIGENGVVVSVSLDAADDHFRAQWIADDEPKSAVCSLTMLAGDTVAIVWVRDEELSAYLPLRVSGGDDSATLLYPDEKEVERLISSGKIKGHHDGEKSAWILSAEVLEKHLVGKQFWRLDFSMALLRKQTEAAEKISD